MNIFLSLDGTAHIIDPEPIYQGSNGVTTVTVISAIPNATAMALYFVLPDELETKLGPYPMALVIPKVGEYNAWTWKLTRSVTEFVGKVEVVINAVSGSQPDDLIGNENTTSYACAFNVEKGTIPVPPSTLPPLTAWETILTYMEAAMKAAGNTMTAVNPIAFKTKATSIKSDEQAYANLTLSYNGTEIKRWSSTTGEWTQLNPDPDAETADPTLWTYELTFGLPRSTVPGPKGPSVAAGAQNIAILSSDAEWTEASGSYAYAISAARHALGATPNIGVFVTVQDGENNNSVEPNYSVADDGTVTIKATSPFNGTALLVAGAVMNGVVTTETLGVADPTNEMLDPSVSEKYQQEANKQFVEAVEDLQDKVIAAQETADTAETAAGNAQSTADGKVSKSGDTMTGNLTAPMLKGTGGVFDGDKRVYSENNPPPSGAVPSNRLPYMDGTASAGTGTAYSRNDHVHPKDDTKADVDGTYADMTVGNANESMHAGYADIAMQLGTETIGDANSPIYLQAGSPQWCTRTIPLVTLNGEIKTTPSFYAPANGGSDENLLVGNGTTRVPVWRGSGTYRSGQSVTASLVADYVTSFYRSSDGLTWYRRWSSGWKECGMTYSFSTTNNGTYTATFPAVGFVDDTVTVNVTNGNWYSSEWACQMGVTAVSKNGVTFRIAGSTISKVYITACGY